MKKERLIYSLIVIVIVIAAVFFARAKPEPDLYSPAMVRIQTSTGYKIYTMNQIKEMSTRDRSRLNTAILLYMIKSVDSTKIQEVESWLP